MRMPSPRGALPWSSQAQVPAPWRRRDSSLGGLSPKSTFPSEEEALVRLGSSPCTLATKRNPPLEGFSPNKTFPSEEEAIVWPGPRSCPLAGTTSPRPRPRRGPMQDVPQTPPESCQGARAPRRTGRLRRPSPGQPAAGEVGLSRPPQISLSRKHRFTTSSTTMPAAGLSRPGCSSCPSPWRADPPPS